MSVPAQLMPHVRSFNRINGLSGVSIRDTSVYDFHFEGQNFSFDPSNEFSLSEAEIADMACDYLTGLCPRDGSYEINIGFITRAELFEDGSCGPTEIVECEINAVPLINSLPLYTFDNQRLMIRFNPNGVIEADCHFSEDTQLLWANGLTEGSAIESHGAALSIADAQAFRSAYYVNDCGEPSVVLITENQEENDARVYYADSGNELKY